MKELTVLSVTLNKQSNEINGLIEELNHELSKLNLGLESWLEYEPIKSWRDEDLPSGQHFENQLGYTRVADGWELAVRQVVLVERPNGDKETILTVWMGALLKCDRETRIRSMQHIPRLLDLIRMDATAVIESIDAARKALETISVKTSDDLKKLDELCSAIEAAAAKQPIPKIDLVDYITPNYRISPKNQEWYLCAKCEDCGRIAPIMPDATGGRNQSPLRDAGGAIELTCEGCQSVIIAKADDVFAHRWLG